MALAEVPAVLILVGLAAYVVFAGADFGAGLWYLLAGPGRRGRAIRDFSYHAMAPVWEANHVWLIFVLVVAWTAYPTAFGSIASTLALPLFVAAVGIILRGTAYALRSGAPQDRETEGATGFVFGASSILTPLALGAAVGAIASGRVPVGNAEGDLVTSWLNATSLLIGALAVATAGYLAAVYLAGDAVRERKPELARAFRVRALAMGLVAGALAVGGLVVLREDSRPLFDGLTSGAGLAAVLVSALVGLVTLALVRAGRYEPARFSAALAVAAIVAGWGIAQSPDLLPGLTIEDAAAGRSTLWALLISIAAGLVILVPSLALLYGLVLRGRFDLGAPAGQEPPQPQATRGARGLAAAAVTLLVVGVALTLFADGIALAIGVLSLVGFIALGAIEFLRP
ncbi:MAG TPA: cytochrome d ubiquinol oxidase subunit II, partial [Thermoleophilaceae bacterium]